MHDLSPDSSLDADFLRQYCFFRSLVGLPTWSSSARPFDPTVGLGSEQRHSRTFSWVSLEEAHSKLNIDQGSIAEPSVPH